MRAAPDLVQSSWVIALGPVLTPMALRSLR
jgi:hypothetical protein